MKKQFAIFAAAALSIFGAVSATAEDLPSWCHRGTDGRVYCQLCPVGGCGGGRMSPLGLSEIGMPVR